MTPAMPLHVSLPLMQYSGMLHVMTSFKMSAEQHAAAVLRVSLGQRPCHCLSWLPASELHPVFLAIFASAQV